MKTLIICALMMMVAGNAGAEQCDICQSAPWTNCEVMVAKCRTLQYAVDTWQDDTTYSENHIIQDAVIDAIEALDCNSILNNCDYDCSGSMSDSDFVARADSAYQYESTITTLLYPFTNYDRCSPPMQTWEGLDNARDNLNAALQKNPPNPEDVKLAQMDWVCHMMEAVDFCGDYLDDICTALEPCE